MQLRRLALAFALAFGASLAVTGVAAGLAGASLSAAVWQSLAIAVLVAAGSAWLTGEQSNHGDTARTSIGPANDELSELAEESRPGAPMLESLEEQGITIKLLELIALGDRYGNVFSVAMIGVDHLEDIGDHYDHEVTVDLLDKVSSALAHTLRMPDRVGELGGGAYLVVLPETNLPGAIQIAERLRGAVSRLDIPASDRVHIHTTASVGVTSFRRGDDLLSLIRRAENALRQAQKQGRNRVLPDLAA